MPLTLPLLGSSYKYRPLDPSQRQIRLISIDAIGKKRHAGRVIGEITGIDVLVHTASLDQGRQVYQALSYPWSKDDSLKKIEVRDYKGRETAKKAKKLEISESIYNMLLHFVTIRNNGTPDGRNVKTSLYLWIDQICINQKDLDERTSQVGMMGDIYGKADRTLVWLGFPSADSNLALDFVEHFNWNCYSRLVGKKAEVPEIQPVHPACANPQDPRPWLAFRSLLSRPWWSRTWIIQEAILSKNCEVLCGTASARLSMFGHVVKGFSHHAQDHALMPHYVRHAFRGIPFVEFLSRWTSISVQLGSGLGQGGYPIIKLLRLASTAGCSEHQDRIFALLSISAQNYRDNIKVDYKSPIPNVMLQSFSYIIRTAGLSGLQLGKLQKTQNFGLPSWVPDLGTKYADGQWLWHRDHTENPWLADGRAADWNKLGGLEWTMPGQGASNVRFSADLRTLACRGVVFDTIETVEPANLHSKAEIEAAVVGMLDIDPEINKKRIEQLQRLVEAMRPAGPEVYPDKLMALMMTLMANRLGAQRATPKYKNPAESAWAQTATDDEKGKRRALLLQENTFVCHERTFVVTSRGYFGIAPPGAKHGDLVCVLHTAHVPFVLREMAGEAEPCYEFVGDAYVHGVSEGEIFEWIKANKIAVQEFWLR